MSYKHGPHSTAVLHHLLKKGDKNRLELERELGIGGLAPAISTLRQSGHIKSLAKQRLQLVRYEITNKGRETIGAHLKKQEFLGFNPVMQRPVYVPEQPFVRPGAMRAYELPSRGMGV